MLSNEGQPVTRFGKLTAGSVVPFAKRGHVALVKKPAKILKPFSFFFRNEENMSTTKLNCIHASVLRDSCYSSFSGKVIVDRVQDIEFTLTYSSVQNSICMYVVFIIKIILFSFEKFKIMAFKSSCLGQIY